MCEQKGYTDQLHQIKLPSAIHHVVWSKRAAAVGGLVHLDIFTHYVGNSSEMKVELTDGSGKVLGNYSDKINNNRFSAPIRVPDNAKDMLYATVKLPKHDLSMKSAPLVVLPPVQITNCKWDKKEARRGDILKLTAEVKGVPEGAEAQIEIWEHDADGAHDFVTKFPVLVKNRKVEAEWEFEYHEDTDDIPTAEESERGYLAPEYFFRVRIEEASGESAKIKFQDSLEIKLTSAGENPIAEKEYLLHLPDGAQKKGKLDRKGYARVENLPPGKVRVEFPDYADAKTIDVA